MTYIKRLVNWYFSKKSLPYWCVYIFDNIVVCLSLLVIFQQFHSGTEALALLEQLFITALLYTAMYAIGFKAFRTYYGIIRYSSFDDLKRVGYAMLLGTAMSEVLAWIIGNNSHFVRFYPSHIVYAALLSTVLLWGFRVLVKVVFDVSLKSAQTKYAFIYGVSSSSIGLAKQIKNEKPMRFDLKGFISDKPNATQRMLMGRSIYSTDKHLIELMRNEGIEVVIVDKHEMNSFNRNEDLQNHLINNGIKIYISEWAREWDGPDNNESKGLELKEVSVEDLLPRDEIQVDLAAVREKLKGRVIMITGSAGSIGGEIVTQVAQFEPRCMLLIDQAETPQHDLKLRMRQSFPDVDVKIIVNTICDQKAMEQLFSQYRPEYVFHAAAYKHVPMMEDNPAASIKNNVVGTKIVADLAVKYGASKFVMISTDKAVNPTNVMGCSKRICEIYVQSLDKAIKQAKCNITTIDGLPAKTQFVTTRFGNVLGSNGSVIPLFKEQIRKGGPVTVTDPRIIRYFMLIPEACCLVLEAGAKGNGGEIFVFDMGNPVKIADLAKRMIRLSGATGVEIEYVGLRPGEKLYEEVLNLKETTKESFHPKIRIADVRPSNYDEVCQQVEQLIKCADTCDNMKIVGKMKEMVPEYKSKNSVYEVLDN